MRHQWLGSLFLTTLLVQFIALLLLSANVPSVAAGGASSLLGTAIGGSWFTWGMLLFSALNILAVLFAVLYLRARADTP